MKYDNMETMNFRALLRDAWETLYPCAGPELLDDFVAGLESASKQMQHLPPQDKSWYKEAVVYSLYVDLFNGDFRGLTDKLDYLQDLGVSCLWLLPILDSPMKDAGFDIRDYRRIRPDLLGLPENASEEAQKLVFRGFLEEAHARGIRVIFDIALNHTSAEHFWFRESRKSPDNPYRNFYIWNKDKEKYKETRLLFKGMCPSNWEQDGDWYYFHRFFEHQPDLNYKNPVVLLEMCRNMLFWLQEGIDGFRADAIPYLWKEDKTNCENLPQTHTIVKFFRAALEIARPGTLLLAEACQPPAEVVKYFGEGDECHAGYHFPLMPQIFKAFAVEEAAPVIGILDPAVTPPIPEVNQWFLFLRVHDELTLEMVTEEDRRIIHGHFCRDPRWDFRVGEGISARLAELLDRDPRKIGLAYSIMLTLPGTPLVYYGDETGKTNDEAYYEEMIRRTGHNDTRFLVRGRIDWEKTGRDQQAPASLAFQVFQTLRNQIKTRKLHPVFGRGELVWLNPVDGRGKPVREILSYKRFLDDEAIMVVQNLSGKNLEVRLPLEKVPAADLLDQLLNPGNAPGSLRVPPYGYFWIKEK